NSEALEELRKIEAKSPNDRVFAYKHREWYRRAFNAAEKATGIRVNPQDLRRWHADKLERLGMPEKYIEFLQGKVPRTTLRRHYTDYSTEKVRDAYLKAGLKVLPV
ncbi:MAG: integrase, partial [Thaumarchaeota archaeon]|nr:integrase [Nitrososphaerota archaeon]